MIGFFVRLQVNLHGGSSARAGAHALLCWKSPYFAIFSPQFLHIDEVSFIPIYRKRRPVMSKKQKVWIATGVSVVVIIALVLVIASIRSQNSSSTAAYQTTTVQLGTLISSVDGSGTLASTQSANLAWQNSGQVDQVSAQTGTQVKAGDVLATLLQDSQTRIALETNLVTAQENLAELTSPETIANAKLAVTTAQSDVQNAQYLVYNQQYWKNDALINNQYASVVIAKEKLDKAQEAHDKANVGEYINNTSEAILVQALYNAQQSYDTAYNYYSLYSQKPSQRQLDEAQATLDLANAQLASAQNYLAALTGGDVPADATGTSLLKFKEGTLAVQTAQENLDAIKLTAPFDGTITQADVIPNAVVPAGTQAFRIDNLSSLVVAVQVTEIDINGIQAGQPATITFDAIPNKTYNGKVIKSDLAGTVSQNSVNFSVTVQITDANAQIKPGMAANVTIVTNQVANALLVPSTSIFTDTSGQQYVYLIQNSTLTTVLVTVGAVSDSTTQITNDTLKEGDTIVLSFASTSSTSSGGFGLGGLGGFGGGVRVVNP
jgi:HlyD family secretion protein